MTQASEAVSPYMDLCSRRSSEVASDLESYFELLQKWQKAQNLVSRETLTVFWERHVRDSLQALRYLDPNHHNLLDLGSGGGFPAIPLAVACKGDGRQFTLVDSNKRKVSFLRTVIRELELPAKVIDSRVDALTLAETGPIDVTTSRATAALDVLLDWICALNGDGASALLHKGREFREEVLKARAKFAFDMVDYPSDTDASGAILRLSQIRRLT